MNQYDLEHLREKQAVGLHRKVDEEAVLLACTKQNPAEGISYAADIFSLSVRAALASVSPESSAAEGAALF